MRESLIYNLGVVTASVLVLLSAGHLYWALGGRLGGRLEGVLLPEQDGQPVFRPSPAAAVGAAIVLLAAAAVLAIRAGALDSPFGEPTVRWAARAVAAVFLLRSIGDFRWVGFFRRVRGTRFAYWDARVYTPVAFALGVGAAVVAWGSVRDLATVRRTAALRDTTFAGVQRRGQVAMGVDQYTSTHIFESLPDGGRITLQRDVDDSVGTSTIRAHLQHIANAFAEGDFRLPGLVHAQSVPGTTTMTVLRHTIHYTMDTLPRGGVVRLRSRDSAAVRAIHEFLAFQRLDHHAEGHPAH